MADVPADTPAQAVGSDVQLHGHAPSSIVTLAPTAPDGSEWELVEEMAYAVDGLVVSDATTGMFSLAQQRSPRS